MIIHLVPFRCPSPLQLQTSSGGERHWMYVGRDGARLGGVARTNVYVRRCSKVGEQSRAPTSVLRGQSERGGGTNNGEQAKRKEGRGEKKGDTS